MTYRADLTSSFERKAEWHREAQDRWPNNRHKHHRAAKIFDALAFQSDRGEFDQERFDRYCRLAYGDLSFEVSTEATMLLREVGFSEFPATVDHYLETLLARVKGATA